MKRNNIVILAFVALTACGDSSAEGGGGSDTGPAGPGSGPGPSTTGTGAGGDGGTSTTGGNGGVGGVGGTGGTGATDCFLDPTVHVEIINACTDSLRIDKVEQVGIWDEGDPLPALP